jgi:hypothetical protein
VLLIAISFNKVVLNAVLLIIGSKQKDMEANKHLLHIEYKIVTTLLVSFSLFIPLIRLNMGVNWFKTCFPL